LLSLFLDVKAIGFDDGYIGGWADIIGGSVTFPVGAFVGFSDLHESHEG